MNQLKIDELIRYFLTGVYVVVLHKFFPFCSKITITSDNTQIFVATFLIGTSFYFLMKTLIVPFICYNILDFFKRLNKKENIRSSICEKLDMVDNYKNRRVANDIFQKFRNDNQKLFENRLTTWSSSINMMYCFSISSLIYLVINLFESNLKDSINIWWLLLPIFVFLFSAGYSHINYEKRIYRFCLYASEFYRFLNRCKDPECLIYDY